MNWLDEKRQQPGNVQGTSFPSGLLVFKIDCKVGKSGSYHELVDWESKKLTVRVVIQLHF